jgi:tetratricopeptide (TPR) repeat protein
VALHAFLLGQDSALNQTARLRRHASGCYSFNYRIIISNICWGGFYRMKKQWLLLLFPVALIAILVVIRQFAGKPPTSDNEITSQKPAVVLQNIAPAGNVPKDEVPNADLAAQQRLAPEIVDKLSTTMEKYIKDNPKAADIADAYFNLGNLYYQGGQFEKAIEPLKKALVHHPYDADAHYTLGNTYDKLKRHAEAAKEFEALTRIEPQNDSVYYNLGNAFSNQQKNEQAIEQYKKAIGLNPKNGPAHYALGLAYQRLNKPKEAVQALQEAVNLDANNAEAHFSLGLAKLESGDRKGALDQQDILTKMKLPYAQELNKRINPQ